YLSIKIDANNKDYRFLNFVLFFPDENRWDNNRGKNYIIRLPIETTTHKISAVEGIKEEIKDREVIHESVETIGKEGEEVAWAVYKDGDHYKVTITSNIEGGLILHWGVSKNVKREWLLPDKSYLPEGSEIFENSAARTPFIVEDGLNTLRLDFGKNPPLGISFVLFQPESGRWLKKHGGNFYIPIVLEQEGQLETPTLSSLADEIISAEMGKSSWTLMHRFNLCYDLLKRVWDDREGLALLFVWLRFSAIRQLDWQRRYNTKPRELSHAQDRLTLLLTEIYKKSKNLVSKRLIRLMLSTVGRGGEGGVGQRIRDEILNIMHRHKIKEVAGHFMEEWHQKLHNNTTPDDIVICEAYLAFLRSDGDLDVFYKTCEAGGVSKERLRSYERPIVTDPDFVPHLKEALIKDFENYLKILKAVHAANDLEIALERAKDFLEGKTVESINELLKHSKDPGSKIVELLQRLTDIREEINRIIEEEHDIYKVRDLLYLDLALEDHLRLLIERNIDPHTDEDVLIPLISIVLKNLRFSKDNKELSACYSQWEALRSKRTYDKDWALKAKSVLDRLSREIGEFIDLYHILIQKKAEYLGKAFHADPWTIELFTEEVIRGRPLFVMSMLIRYLEAKLRKRAHLGDWQVISPNSAIGEIVVVNSLKSIQGKSFERPTIVITDKVFGDEEPPRGVTGIITHSAVDILSHIAVRTRNYHIFFATCYESDIINTLKSMEGKVVRINIDGSGGVNIEEVEELSTSEKQPALTTIHIEDVDATFTSYVIPFRMFNKKVVGGKSYNLKRIRDKLPDWIKTPPSVAMPFGVFQRVLDDEKNRDIAVLYNRLVSEVDKDYKKILPELKKTVLSLRPPEDLLPTLYKVMEEEGLPTLREEEDLWMCIKRVWASKWNERAYLSRRANNIPHEAIKIAILIQQLVEADYAFVIHTINPFTKDKNELYGEVVLGLGETLVGNYPGRALSFICNKNTMEIEIVSYPDKSVALYGSGLIFRSDSSGEDLEKYAGAGLYDSILFPPNKGEVFIDYTNEPLITDERFRTELLRNIAKIGIEVEKACDYIAQDIEGAYSKGEYYLLQSRNQV
ncbi:MAG: hypothetical protein D6828_04970, partial [Nitrospirae bacterium]